MTTNIERAAALIAPCITRDSEQAEDIAWVLADAGLLVPDPVAPYAAGISDPGGKYALFATPTHPDGAAAYGGRVEITHTIVPDERGYTPQQARDIAACLLSAADYAEEHTDGLR